VTAALLVIAGALIAHPSLTIPTKSSINHGSDWQMSQPQFP
jgi:hypothetical protein